MNQDRNQNLQRKKHNSHNISNNPNNIPSLLSLPIQPPDFPQTNQNLFNELGSVPPPPPPPPPQVQHTYAQVQPSIMPGMVPFANLPGPLLQQIPPPKPLSLNAIPAPRELDLTAIPEPQMNVEAIQIPELSNQLHPMHRIPNIDNPGG